MEWVAYTFFFFGFCFWLGLQVWESANLFAFCILAVDFLIKIKTNSKGQQWKCHIIVELLPLATRAARWAVGEWAWSPEMGVC